MPQARVWVVGIDPAPADGKMVPQPGLPRAVGHGAKASGLTVAPPSLFWEVSRTRAAPRMIGSVLGADTCTSLADEAMGNEAAQFHHVSRRRQAWISTAPAQKPRPVIGVLSALVKRTGSFDATL